MHYADDNLHERLSAGEYVVATFDGGPLCRWRLLRPLRSALEMLVVGHTVRKILATDRRVLVSYPRGEQVTVYYSPGMEIETYSPRSFRPVVSWIRRVLLLLLAGILAALFADAAGAGLWPAAAVMVLMLCRWIVGDTFVSGLSVIAPYSMATPSSRRMNSFAALTLGARRPLFEFVAELNRAIADGATLSRPAEERALTNADPAYYAAAPQHTPEWPPQEDRP